MKLSLIPCLSPVKALHVHEFHLENTSTIVHLTWYCDGTWYSLACNHFEGWGAGLTQVSTSSLNTMLVANYMLTNCLGG